VYTAHIFNRSLKGKFVFQFVSAMDNAPLEQLFTQSPQATHLNGIGRSSW
jgi:hypothetical protein